MVANAQGNRAEWRNDWPESAPATMTWMTPDDSPKSLRVMTWMSYLRPGSRCLIIAQSSRDGGVATRHFNVPVTFVSFHSFISFISTTLDEQYTLTIR